MSVTEICRQLLSIFLFRCLCLRDNRHEEHGQHSNCKGRHHGELSARPERLKVANNEQDKYRTAKPPIPWNDPFEHA
jgi:hypothetical protein